MFKSLVTEDGAVNMLYPALKAWEVPSANWLEWKSGSPWENKGGPAEDYMNIPAGGGDFDSSKVMMEIDDGDQFWETYDVSQVLPGMISVVNNGFVLEYGLWDAAFAKGRDYHSNRASNVDDRPKLVVEVVGTAVIPHSVEMNKMVSVQALGHSISLKVDKAGLFKADLYDSHGRNIITKSVSGYDLVNFDGVELASGVYLLQVSGTGFKMSKSVVLE